MIVNHHMSFQVQIKKNVYIFLSYIKDTVLRKNTASFLTSTADTPLTN